jgi:multiple sugar transport system substrate-binding protein
MEAPQYDAWLEQSVGYFTQTLKSYESNKVWSEDPKRAVFKEACTRTLDMGYAGPLGYAAAGALADFVIVDMVSQAATGQTTVKEAMETAQKRAERYYRV